MIDFDEMLREHKYLEELRIHAEELEKRNQETEKRVRESVRNFKALGLSEEQIASALGLPLEELAR
ncbi:conserved hypothetical protein [Treponema primitia ZAS-2]|uniref:Uncharacterized protein n=1 Tax=Treponema primitia (strain ATCC BAA-887 / DSM 12427 / ZAS-2) TaxID=545694 RepID=F5YR96_TREPZ|nr:hypothetical protein [Treponema primitia]AEF84909.1 conserved hypothetical protein [Treponema primitia ZAS-2]